MFIQKPDRSVIDASVALKGMLLAVKHKNFDLTLARFDSVTIDTASSELLGHNPKKQPCLTLVSGRPGNMDNIEIINV